MKKLEKAAILSQLSSIGPEASHSENSFTAATYTFTESQSNVPILRRPPLAICLSCGAYINHSVDFKTKAGKWICSFCFHENGGLNLLSTEEKDLPVELRSDGHSYHCIETEPLPCSDITLSASGIQSILVMVIDLMFLRHSHTSFDRILEMLSDGLEKLVSSLPYNSTISSSSHVLVCFFDESTLRVARLGERSVDPLVVDVLPLSLFVTNRSNCWVTLLKKGLHSLSIEGFLQDYASISLGLKSFVQSQSPSRPHPSSNPNKSLTSFTLTHLYSLVVGIQSIYSTRIEIKASLFTSLSLPLYPISSTSNSNHSSGQFLGHCFSVRGLTSIDYFFIGNQTVVVHELATLVSATRRGAGHLILGESLEERHISDSFISLLIDFLMGGVTHQRSSPQTHTATNISNREVRVEIRCSETVHHWEYFPRRVKQYQTLRDSLEMLRTGRLIQKTSEGFFPSALTRSTASSLPSHRERRVQEGSRVLRKRFPLVFTASPASTDSTTNTATGTSTTNEILDFDPVTLFQTNPTVSEEELEEQYQLSQYLDLSHLRNSYQHYLSYLEDQKTNHNNPLVVIPFKVFYDKIKRSLVSQQSRLCFEVLPGSSRIDSSQPLEGDVLGLVISSVSLGVDGEEEEVSHNSITSTATKEGYFWNHYLSTVPDLFASLLGTNSTRVSGGSTNNNSNTSHSQSQRETSDHHITIVTSSNNPSPSEKTAGGLPLMEDNNNKPLPHAIVQIIVKSSHLDVSRGERVKETKVTTLPVPLISSNTPNHSRDHHDSNTNTDDTLSGRLQIQAVIRRYHLERSRLSFTSSNLMEGREESLTELSPASLRQFFVDLIDRSVRSLSRQSEVTREDLKFIRSLFFLREGGLLDGPVSNEEESFYLRQLALRQLHEGYGDRLVTPRMWLDVSYLSTATTTTTITTTTTNTDLNHNNNSSGFIEVPSESLMLLPGTITLVDSGNLMIIRRNIPPLSFSMSPDYSEDRALLPLITFAEEIARKRIPVPRIEVLRSPGSPNDRLVYSRLSPSHMYFLKSPDSLPTATSLLRTVLPEFAAFPQEEERISGILKVFTEKDFEALLTSLPFTDQLYFSQYFHLHMQQPRVSLGPSSNGPQLSANAIPGNGIPNSMKEEELA